MVELSFPSTKHRNFLTSLRSVGITFIARSDGTFYSQPQIRWNFLSMASDPMELSIHGLRSDGAFYSRPQIRWNLLCTVAALRIHTEAEDHAMFPAYT
jgi:hypothetical protein